ncbi:Uncharacterized protein GBIM_14206, partial [Gryllus bimaculatus]
MAGRIGRSERDEHIEWEALDTHRVEGAGIVISAAMAGQKVRAGVYYDIDTVQDPIKIMINMSQPNIGRFWEIKITQLEFQQRAPSGCLQYHREASGIIQTMNFAVNGRHLANQDYKICMRQEM